jgi:hypothetical protein
MHRKFASVQHPDKYGYAFDSEAWSSRGAEVSQYFQMFETYNDGLCQHSSAWPITREFMADYMASLATVLMTIDPREEDNAGNLIQRLSYDFTRTPRAGAIEFAASVVFKGVERPDGTESGYEKKKRWYSMELQQISSAPVKQYDKRFVEVEPWNNGTPKAIFRMLQTEYASGLDTYALAETLRDWVHALPEGAYSGRYMFMPLASELLEWFQDDKDRREKAQNLRRAFGAVKALCMAYNLRCEAENHLNNLRIVRQNTEPATEVA